MTEPTTFDAALAALTPKHRKFVLAYLDTFNATRAAIDAGYSDASANSHAPRVLARPDVTAAVEAAMREHAMRAPEVLARLADQARATLEDFITVDEHGGARIDLARARAAGKLHLVKSVKQTRHGLHVELHDSQAALKLIAQHLGLLIDRHEIGGPNGAPIKFIAGVNEDDL